MKSLSVFPLLLSLVSSCQGAVVYVNKTASGATQDGQSWATAFHDVRDGLDLAVSGDEVWVAQGTYLTTNVTIALPSGIALYGGFNGTETARDQRDAASNATILDGGPVGVQRKRVLTIADNATSDTIVDGFTIQNGDDAYVYDSVGQGGGVYINGGSPVVSNNVITSNRTGGTRTGSTFGGGICIVGGTPLIVGNTITNNYAIDGGGIYAAGGTIRDNVIANNVAQAGYADTGTGGGILLQGTATAVHNMIVANQQYGSYGEGGGIACFGGTVTDNLFMDNDGFYGGAVSASGNTLIARNAFTGTGNLNDVQIGGGTFSDNLMVTRYDAALVFGLSGQGNGNSALVSNNTFVHTGPHSGCAIYSSYRNGETPVVSNNIFTGWQGAAQQDSVGGTLPTVSTDHNDIYGNTSNTIALNGASQVGQNGNIGVDPLFVNASNGDFHLQQNSPCINAGNDAYVTAGDTDLDGKPRILGSHVDFGAYEAVPVNAAAFQQALRALRIAAGLGVASSADVTQLNVETAGASASRVDLRDAVHLLRSAVGIGS